MSHFLGLRTAAYSARHLAAAKAWYTEVLGMAPYFDQPFYVGFKVGGYEFGIMREDDATPDRAAIPAGIAYWGVTDAAAAYERLIGLGARPHEPVQDVGEGIKVATVRDPFGNILGVIENPTFRVESA